MDQARKLRNALLAHDMEEIMMKYILFTLFSFHALYSNNFISFHASMQNAKNYDSKYAEKHLGWKKAITSYNYFINNFNSLYSITPKIPKIIHQIWLGSPLPKKETSLTKTWAAHHPDWLYILWREKDIEQLKLHNKKLYDATHNFGEKSDLARIEILERIGGLYIDTDFECLKPFDELVHRCDFFAGISFVIPKSDTVFETFNGLIGSIPHHPILKRYISDVAKSKNKDITRKTGPYFFGKTILKDFNKYDLVDVIFPTSYFYPWPNTELKNNARKEIEKWIKPESYAIHHWHVSWHKKKGSHA